MHGAQAPWLPVYSVTTLYTGKLSICQGWQIESRRASCLSFLEKITHGGVRHGRRRDTARPLRGLGRQITALPRCYLTSSKIGTEAGRFSRQGWRWDKARPPLCRAGKVCAHI
ncbi:MAG: hypothetical protein LBD20_07500 [Spirochaetaceae bacterium]|nr:hypothetical protein [Spirochaetaceae bacterium]